MRKGEQTMMRTIERFLEEHDGGLSVRYYNSIWHATIMFDDGKAGRYFEAEHNYIHYAIKRAWVDAKKSQQESVTNP